MGACADRTTRGCVLTCSMRHASRYLLRTRQRFCHRHHSARRGQVSGRLNGLPYSGPAENRSCFEPAGYYVFAVAADGVARPYLDLCRLSDDVPHVVFAHSRIGGLYVVPNAPVAGGPQPSPSGRPPAPTSL